MRKRRGHHKVFEVFKPSLSNEQGHGAASYLFGYPCKGMLFARNMFYNSGMWAYLCGMHHVPKP